MRSRVTPPVKSDTVFDRRGNSTSQSSAPARRAGDRREPALKDSRTSDSRAGESRTRAPLKEEAAARKRRATRDGREALVVYMPADSIKALKIAAVEQDTSASAIVTGLVAAWLQSQGRRAKP